MEVVIGIIVFMAFIVFLGIIGEPFLKLVLLIEEAIIGKENKKPPEPPKPPKPPKRHFNTERSGSLSANLSP